MCLELLLITRLALDCSKVICLSGVNADNSLSNLAGSSSLQAAISYINAYFLSRMLLTTCSVFSFITSFATAISFIVALFATAILSIITSFAPAISSANACLV